MIFLGYTSGTKGFKFMQKPNNVIFHGVTAMFDEHMFPSCPDNISPGSTRIRANCPGTELNIPPEDGDVDGGDAFFLNVSPAGGGPHYYGPPGGPSGCYDFSYFVLFTCLFIIFRSESWHCGFDSLLFDSYCCHTIDS